jgi:KaiC/GvpD/RAD55 family RecA-like ATPase
VKTFKEFNPQRVDFIEEDQDFVISQLIFNTDFLLKCKRKGLEPDLFTGEIRRQLVDYIFEFHDKYKEAPQLQVQEILDGTTNGFRTKLRSEDIDGMADFISNLTFIQSTPGKVKRLYDRLAQFVDKRIIYTTISNLNKAKDRLDGSPEALREIVDDASRKLAISSSMESTLGLFDEDDFEQEAWLTRFNINAIDSAYGGGLSAPNLVVLQGFTGRGKTWSICHLTKMGLRLGNDAVVLVTEMNAKKFLTRMRTSLTGMTWKEYQEDKFAAWEIMKKSLVRGSQLHLISDAVKLDKDFTIDSLAGMVEEIEEKTKKDQKLILIDSPDDMEPPKGEIYRSPIEKSKAIYTWLRNYSQDKNKLVIVTSQSQRRSETLLWTTSGNIGDDLNKVRRATLGISINGYKSEVEAGFIRLLVFKNTYGPEMKAAWIETDFNRGMFRKDDGEIKGLSIEDYKKKLLSLGITLTNRSKGISE